MICTNEINRICCIAQPHHQVIVKDVTLDMALGAFGLNGKVKYSTMRYRVHKARKGGTYDRARASFVASLVADCAQKNQDIGGLCSLVIDLTTNANSSLDLSSVSTGTIVTLASTTDAGTGGSSEVLSVSSLSDKATPEKTKRTRKTHRQANLSLSEASFF